MSSRRRPNVAVLGDDAYLAVTDGAGRGDGSPRRLGASTVRLALSPPAAASSGLTAVGAELGGDAALAGVVLDVGLHGDEVVAGERGRQGGPTPVPVRSP
jgi:hypothetical protein